jgi:hypothetical protein
MISPRNSFVTESIESGNNSVNSTTLLNNNDGEEFIGKSITSCCLLTLIMPCVVCDLFFAITDKTCVNENVANINLKQYLLGTGIFAFSIIVINIISLFTISGINNELCILFMYIVNIIGTIFTIIWNIIGAVIFWGTIYKENICSSQVSTYLFVVLIFRLLSIYGCVQQLSNSK